MNLGQLREVFWRQMGDVAEPHLWTIPEVDEFANDAVMEACRRGHLIIDSTTALICTIAYTSASAVLTLDPRIIAIRWAGINGQTIPLDRIQLSFMDGYYPTWRTATASVPTVFIPDWGSNTIRLHPAPTVSGTVNLTVVREPLVAMTLDTHIPEIPARYHKSLIHWMRFRAYDKDDTETRNQPMVDRMERRFASEFGERRSARNERWAAQQVPQFADTLC